MGRRPAVPWTVGALVLLVALVACRGEPGSAPVTVTLTSRTTTGPEPTTTAATSATTTEPAVFEAQILPASEALLGSSWREGCPVGPDDLRLLLVVHRDFDGMTRVGELIVHRDLAEEVVDIFHRLYEAGFPIERMEPVQLYGSDDDRSMAANNTSGFNCRYVEATTDWSEHAYGRAVDINPVQNPYVRGSSVAPPAGGAYLDRTDIRPGMIVDEDAVVRAFASAGWPWGGHWTNPDYQHFSSTGR